MDKMTQSIFENIRRNLENATTAIDTLYTLIAVEDNKISKDEKKFMTSENKNDIIDKDE